MKTLFLVLLCFFTLALAQTAKPVSIVALEKLEGRAFDIAFMSQMLEHHAILEQIGQTVYAEVKRPIVQDLSWDITVQSRTESKSLLQWLRTWFDTTPDQNQMLLTRKDLSETLKYATGRVVAGHDMNMSGDADQVFVRGLITLNLHAMTMAKLVATKSTKSELKAFAQQMITQASQQNKQVESWLATWK